MSFAYYRWFSGDYARDTRHLTMLQHGAYRQLIDAYMASERPLRGDMHAMHRICGALSGEERQAVEFVLVEFFRQDGPVWRHPRCDRELEYLKNLSEAGRRANAIRWHSDGSPIGSRSDSDGYPNQNQNQRSTKPKPIVRQKTSHDVPEGFARFWTTYPNKGRRVDKAKCLKLWLKNGLEQNTDTIVAHVTAMKLTPKWCCEPSFEPMPATYLNRCRWEDGLPNGGKAPDGKLQVAM